MGEEQGRRRDEEEERDDVERGEEEVSREQSGSQVETRNLLV